MIAADRPTKRPAWARLLVVDQTGRVTASIAGIHVRTAQPIEARLAAWRAPVSATPAVFDVIVFGAGDYRTRTEDRLPPPALAAGDRRR